ncbi:uncharacterized protein LOC113549324 [Rhopalosiphum maidis]|uniref:uncharacterized protein LOC113549324 n=1 Tax=Rhopalosiphum maidis TaxID=43146 RepID=UPI000EFE63A9|nr:uncharacterized protein LOC113549324 [Rhopalosiphum maidis]
MATLSSACSSYVRQQPGQPLKTLNVTNAILRTDKGQASSYRPQCTAKRKSAVELLQETKSLYVKSETVLDRKQELRRSLRSSGSSDKGSSSQDIASGCYNYKGNCCNWSSGSFTCLPPPKSPRLVAGCQRKSTADSQQLQNDLRRLLNTDSKENLFEATSVFLDDVIVPPPVQYRRSVSHSQQQQQHQPCCCGPSATCHKSLPDLTDVTTTATETITDVSTPAVAAGPIRRCRRSASSGSVAAEDDDDDDGEDDIFETYCNIPSPQGFGNKSRQDETDAVANVTSFPDSLSLTSYKTDARWQQSAHGGTGSSIEEENDDEVGGVSPRSSASPVKSTVSHGRWRPHTAGAATAAIGEQEQSPPAVPLRRHQLPTTATDEFRGRPILRSKSDVGHRAPNLLSLLPAAVAKVDDRHEYDPNQLENFFGHLGLDPEEYKWVIKTDSETGSQVCFGGSNSSVGSVSGGSNNNNNANTDGPWAGGGVRGDADGCEPGTGGPIGGCVGKSGVGSSSSELPSIVERNARIIKWLWNCRKANLQQTLLPPTPSST